MKIGITITKDIEEYLKEIAIENGLSKTTICSLIVENFLSYNKRKKKKPIFKKVTMILFKENNEPEAAEPAAAEPAAAEPETNEPTWEELMEDLK